MLFLNLLTGKNTFAQIQSRSRRSACPIAAEVDQSSGQKNCFIFPGFDPPFSTFSHGFVLGGPKNRRRQGRQESGARELFCLLEQAATARSPSLSLLVVYSRWARVMSPMFLLNTHAV
jgi:hypothetical protein